MADARAALLRLQNVEVTRVPCCTPEVAEKSLNPDFLFIDLSLLSRSIDTIIMTDRENGETGIAPHELYVKSNPGLLKIDVTNPREWYRNGEKILTTIYDKKGQRSFKNGNKTLEAGVKSNGGLLLPSVYDRRNEVSPDRSGPNGRGRRGDVSPDSPGKNDKGRNGGAKAFPFLNHLTTVRYTSEPSLNAIDMNGNTDDVQGNGESRADEKENVPDEDAYFEKRNALPMLRNGGQRSNGTVSDSELEGVVYYQRKKQHNVARKGFRSGGGKVLGKTNIIPPKQRSILNDTINFEQYKMKQKSILKLRFHEVDPNQKVKPRPYMYNFQHTVSSEPDYSHVQSKVGSLFRPHGKTAPNEEPAVAPRNVPEDNGLIPEYSPRGYTPKYSFGLDILTGEELPFPSSTPSVKEGHYVYKAPGDGYYQRSVNNGHDGTRTAIVNLALGKDIRSTPSEGLTTSLKGRYRRRKVDSGYTSTTPATEYNSWDDRSMVDYETDEESRGQSRTNGTATAASRYTNLKSAGSLKSNLGKDPEIEKDNDIDNGNQDLLGDAEFRIDSPSKKSVRFSHAEVKVDGLISPSRLGLPKAPGTASGRPKSVLKKFNKIEVFGEKSKRSERAEPMFQNVDSLGNTRPQPATRPPVYKLDKSSSKSDSGSEKLNSKSGDEDDEYMTRIARVGSPTESKMVEIVESYRRYLDQGTSEDPTPRTVAGEDTSEAKQDQEVAPPQDGTLAADTAEAQPVEGVAQPVDAAKQGQVERIGTNAAEPVNEPAEDPTAADSPEDYDETAKDVEDKVSDETEAQDVLDSETAESRRGQQESAEPEAMDSPEVLADTEDQLGGSSDEQTAQTVEQGDTADVPGSGETPDAQEGGDINATAAEMNEGSEKDDSGEATGEALEPRATSEDEGERGDVNFLDEHETSDGSLNERVAVRTDEEITVDQQQE